MSEEEYILHSLTVVRFGICMQFLSELEYVPGLFALRDLPMKITPMTIRFTEVSAEF